jgi:hypothetical protein
MIIYHEIVIDCHSSTAWLYIPKHIPPVLTLLSKLYHTNMLLKAKES